MAAVEYPMAAKVAARLAETADLPTPPLPEATAKMRVLIPFLWKGFFRLASRNSATRLVSFSLLMVSTTVWVVRWAGR